jgi:hypothetical protein
MREVRQVLEAHQVRVVRSVLWTRVEPERLDRVEPEPSEGEPLEPRNRRAKTSSR